MQTIFSRTFWILTGLVIIGLALRLDFAVPHHWIIDSDEAIVGLMAKHIVDGKPIPTFYYGQHYMGSLEAIGAAIAFVYFGISNAALKLTPLLFSLALIPVLYRLGKEIGGRTCGLVTAALVTFAPSPLIVWSAKARGGFIEVIVVGALALLLAVRALRRGPKLTDTANIAILLGLGWWINLQVIYFIGPIGLGYCASLIGWRSPNRNFLGALQHLLVGVLFFLIGGMPFWLYNLQHHFISFEMFQGSGQSEVLDHVVGLFAVALPILLGAKRFWNTDEVFPGSAICFWLIVAAVVSGFVWRFRREILDLIVLRCYRPTAGAALLFVFVLSSLPIFSLSSFGYLVQAPRYLLPLYVGIFPLTALCIAPLFRTNFRRGIVALSATIVLQLLSSYFGGRAIPGEPYVYATERASKDHQELIDWLDAHHISVIRTNYWIGYRLAFETKERVTFVVFQEPHQVRIPDYEIRAEAAHPDLIPLVLVPGQAPRVLQALKLLRMSFKETMLSGYIVLYDLHFGDIPMLSVPPQELSASTALNQSMAQQAIDHDLHTRWGTGTHQAPGQRFEINIKGPYKVEGLRYLLGDWTHDYPRQLSIVAKKSDGTEVTLFTPEDDRSLLFYGNGQGMLEFYFPPDSYTQITLVQEGTHPILDWSIAEIELLYSK